MAMNEGGPDKKKTSKILGAALAAGLAAGSPAHAQDDTRGNRGFDSGGYDTSYTDTGTEDYGSDGYESYEVPSQEVVDTLTILDGELGDSVSVNPEQVAKLRASIDAFVAAHPAHEEELVSNDSETAGRAPYSPWKQLKSALEGGLKVNPAAGVAALQYIKEKSGE
jgi:hypothetical protein